MEHRTLPLSCECGGVPKQISAVGLSSEHELVIHWRCPRCRRSICSVKPLSDCWRDCLTAASANLPKAKPTVDTAYDRKFLHRIGIRYSDAGEAPLRVSCRISDACCQRNEATRPPSASPPAVARVCAGGPSDCCAGRALAMTRLLRSRIANTWGEGWHTNALCPPTN